MVGLVDNDAFFSVSTDSVPSVTSSHTHSRYKTIQTAVSDPTASGTSTSFISTISQNTNGDITVSKASLPSASSSTAGITKVGSSSEGAAAYNHTHTLSIASGGNNPTALSANTTYTLTAGGNSIVFTTPASGSGGGGSTVTLPSNDIELGTGYSNYITVDNTTRRIKLPATCPWNITHPVAQPLSSGNTAGTVIPIIQLSEGQISGNYNEESFTPTLLFSNNSESGYALPVYMDKNGHLFIPISRTLATSLLEQGFSTEQGGGKPKE